MQPLHRNNGGKSECAFVLWIYKTFINQHWPLLPSPSWNGWKVIMRPSWLPGSYISYIITQVFNVCLNHRSRPVAPNKYLGRGFSFKLRHNKPKTISRLFFILQRPWSFLDFRDNYWKVSRATLQEEFYNSRAEVGPCNPTLRGWMEFSSSKRCLGLVRIDSSCGFSLQTMLCH